MGFFLWLKTPPMSLLYNKELFISVHLELTRKKSIYVLFRPLLNSENNTNCFFSVTAICQGKHDDIMATCSIAKGGSWFYSALLLQTTLIFSNSEGSPGIFTACSRSSVQCCGKHRNPGSANKQEIESSCTNE